MSHIAKFLSKPVVLFVHIYSLSFFTWLKIFIIISVIGFREVNFLLCFLLTFNFLRFSNYFLALIFLYHFMLLRLFHTLVLIRLGFTFFVDVLSFPCFFWFVIHFWNENLFLFFNLFVFLFQFLFLFFFFSPLFQGFISKVSERFSYFF